MWSTSILSLLFLIVSPKMTLEKDTTNSFAVVELFTSQGCSSCPAADRLLSELIDKNDNVLALSFHVSYWNYLGWKDPYSSEAFTNRQRAYSSAFRLGRVYTPQMIVNGKEEFVGSNRRQAENAIKSALDQASKHKIKLELNNKHQQLDIKYNLEGSSKGYLINVALVERDVSNKVPRGENGGKTLHHDNVVRAFETTHANKSGVLTLTIPNDINPANAAVIAFTQNAASWVISGATKASLTN